MNGAVTDPRSPAYGPASVSLNPIRSLRGTAIQALTRSVTWPRRAVTTTHCGVTRPTAPPHDGVARSRRLTSTAATQ